MSISGNELWNNAIKFRIGVLQFRIPGTMIRYLRNEFPEGEQEATKMKGADILLSGEVASVYDTTYAVVQGLAEAHGLVPQRVPYSGMAKGWNREARKVFARLLNRDPEGLLEHEPAVSA